jgi:hypothetical protein
MGFFERCTLLDVLVIIKVTPWAKSSGCLPTAAYRCSAAGRERAVGASLIRSKTARDRSLYPVAVNEMQQAIRSISVIENLAAGMWER